MKTKTSSNVRNIRKAFEKDFLSPVGKHYKNGSNSPLDRTVAETPSPAGTGMFTPASLRVRALPSTASKPSIALKLKSFDESSPIKSPEKPFDEESPVGKCEVKRDIESTRDEENIDIQGEKTTQYVRYLNQITKSGVSSPERVSESLESKSKVTAPIPFLYTGSPEQVILSPLATNVSLSDEIAMAEKIGMAERLASVPESQQQTIMMQSFSPPEKVASEVDVLQFVASPASPVRRISMPSYRESVNKVVATPTSVEEEDIESVKPHSLFRSAKKDEEIRSSDKLDQILAREISDAVEAAANESKLYKSISVEESFLTEVTPEGEPGALDSKPLWKTFDSTTMLEEEAEEPFDCTNDSAIDNLLESDQLKILEEGKSEKKSERSFVSKILRNPNIKIKGTKTKKAQKGSSILTPDQLIETMKILRDSNIQSSVSEMYAFDEKSTGEDFDDEPFAPLTFNAGAKNDDMTGRSGRTIQTGSPRNVERGSFSDEEGRRDRTRTALYICILIALVICGVVASVFISRALTLRSKEESNSGDSNSNTWDDDAVTAIVTASPTEYMKDSNVFEGSKTVACENAVPITEMDRAYYGSNWKAFWDPTIDTCGDQMSTGYAVWYSFTTNSSKLVEASTCNNADFDTQITVMSGSCSETACISYNDQGCGDQSLVKWYAEADTTYYIMVHGYREASGTFGLTLSEAFQNDQCDNAVKFEEESVLAGTTAGASSFVQPPQCGDVDLSDSGVWYIVANVSGFFRAELLHGFTDFLGQVSVYQSMGDSNSGCNALVCEKGSSTDNVMWLAEATKTYYVYVNGKSGIAGDFDLFLGHNKAASCNFGTRIDSNSLGYLASTTGLNPQNVESCGYAGYHTAPGLWFSVVGTGDVFEASTCGSLLDLDTQISVFGNGCDSLECIGGTGQDYPCDEKGSITWNTEIGEIYYVYVSGRSGRVGDFTLNINHVPVADGLTCDGSLILEQGSESLQLNTATAPLVPVDRCSGSNAVQGVWYKIVGTGLTMTFSVCNDETDFDARISIFTGSCNGLSCIAHTEDRCGENDEIMITTHVGETYYLFVHGADSSSFGNYLLTIGETEINDSCKKASTLDVSSSAQYFGSTLSAQKNSAIGCSGDALSESNALWYAFMGTGDIVTISTCSYLTDFDTDVHIFSGSCSNFECVSDADNGYAVKGCGQQSSISFQSITDQLYYARIGGNSASDAGSFVLEVNPKSTFFGP
mmetsp:Transcript_24422/g.51579  ORF Transcript_24422/g.51579 Transcript_24422/m.51579 type:complete len:1224 (-) Transcript_24422:2484-6155(-)